MNTATNRSTPPSDVSDDASDTASDTAADAEQAVKNNPAVERVTRYGWIAKGIVYLLMGATAISIARQESPDDQASPSGSIGRIAEQPGGRLLLVVLAAGLALYCVWRLIDLVLVDGDDLGGWVDRAGALASAVAAAGLASIAVAAAVRGGSGDDGSMVESASRSLMETGWGRWLLAAVGVAVVGLGVYFVVRRGLMRSFTDDVRVPDSFGHGDTIDRVVLAAGIAGWVGRGIVTILVGYFVTKGAIEFDPDDARGYDGALREAASSTTGAVLVAVAAVGLIAYGSFCLLSHDRRSAGDGS